MVFVELQCLGAALQTPLLLIKLFIKLNLLFLKTIHYESKCVKIGHICQNWSMLDSICDTLSKGTKWSQKESKGADPTWVWQPVSDEYNSFGQTNIRIYLLQ